MVLCRTFLRLFFLSGFLFLICSTLCAQTDTIPKEPEAHKNFFNQMINNFRKKDTTEVDATYELKRNDAAYNQFANRIIRNILKKRIHFGVSCFSLIKKRGSKTSEPILRTAPPIWQKHRWLKRILLSKTMMHRNLTRRQIMSGFFANQPLSTGATRLTQSNPYEEEIQSMSLSQSRTFHWAAPLARLGSSRVEVDKSEATLQDLVMCRWSRPSQRHVKSRDVVALGRRYNRRKYRSSFI